MYRSHFWLRCIRPSIPWQLRGPSKPLVMLFCGTCSSSNPLQDLTSVGLILVPSPSQRTAARTWKKDEEKHVCNVPFGMDRLSHAGLRPARPKTPPGLREGGHRELRAPAGIENGAAGSVQRPTDPRSGLSILRFGGHMWTPMWTPWTVACGVTN